MPKQNEQIQRYTTQIILFADCPIEKGYFIDDIESYFNLYPSNSKYEFPKNNRNVRINERNLNFKIAADIDDYNSLTSYNYALIKFYNPENQHFRTQYYFINNIYINSDHIIELELELDVLNSYRQYSFSALTFIKRKHCDRWFAPIKFNGYYYLFKKIYPEDDKKELLNLEKYDFYSNDNDQIYKKSFWVKIIINDDHGMNTYYVNFGFDITVNVIGVQEPKTIKSFISYSRTETSPGSTITLLRLLQSYPNLVSMSIIPYPPAPFLRNVGNGQTLDIDGNILDYVEYSISAQINNQTITHAFKFLTTRLDLYMNYDNDEITLNNLYNKDKNSFTKFQVLLFNIFCSKISIAFLNELKPSSAIGWIRPTNNYIYDHANNKGYFNTNEPSSLNSSSFELIFDFNNINYNLLLELIELKEENFNDIINAEFYNNLSNTPLLDFKVKTDYSLSTGILFSISSNKFDYKTVFKTFGKNENADLPQIQNHYIQYNLDRNIVNLKKTKQTIKKISEEIPIRSGWYKKIFGGTINWLGGTIANIRDNISSKFGRASIIQGGVRTARALSRGSVVGAGISALSTVLQLAKEREEENATNSRNEGNFEDVLSANKDYKVSLVVNKEQKVEVSETKYYLTGNEYNKNELPTHNSRLYFDYLECDPIFNNFKGSEIIKNEIKELFNKGVTYIHNVNNNWIFPGEYKENPEITLINRLS